MDPCSGSSSATGCCPMINGQGGARLTDQIKALRRQLASEMGFVMPSVRIQDNIQLPANCYVIRVKEIEAGRGELRPGMLLVMDPKGEPIPCPARRRWSRPSACRPSGREEASREEALFRGYTVVDPATVITTHITEVIKDNMSELLSYAESQKLLDELDEDSAKAGRAIMVPFADFRRRPAARSAEPASRARVDPRSADHPRRPSRRPAAIHARASAPSPSTCAPAWRARSPTRR